MTPKQRLSDFYLRLLTEMFQVRVLAGEPSPFMSANYGCVFSRTLGCRENVVDAIRTCRNLHGWAKYQQWKQVDFVGPALTLADLVMRAFGSKLRC